MQPREILISLSIKFGGDWDLIYRSLKLKKDYEDEQEILENCQKLKCKAVTIMDPEYPEQLNRVPKPPFVLFYEGDLSLIQNTNNCIAVIGSRSPTSFGIETTTNLVKSLPNRVVVVSGMAIGIDTIAHEAAMNSWHKTVAVLGSGIDVCYPTRNYKLFEKIKSDHLLISEYPPGIAPNIPNFPKRNRIVAGLSKSVLVTEAGLQSGTLITVGVAANLGIDVLCLPSTDLGNSGTNYCIKQGAFLVETSDDVNIFYR